MTVNLVIKSATQTVDDFTLECELFWTIGQVKDKIAEVYPNNPKKENQKLIYGGKLLPDHLALRSVLNHAQERHIVHLVCPSPSNVSPKQNVPKEVSESESCPVAPTNPAFPPVNQPILNPPSISGISGVTVAPLNTGDAFQQYLAMQQMYAQFMTQYWSQYNGGGVPPVIPYSPAMTVPPVQTPQVPAPQQSAPPNPPQRQVEEEDRDYLDYMHFVSRAVLLFVVIFYYSSFIRVLVVVTMFIFIAIYGKLSRRTQELEMQQRAVERPNNEAVQLQPVPNAEDIQETESEETAPSEATTSVATLSQQNEGRSIASVLSTTASLISAFFASLIPDAPVPVNVN